MVRNSLNTLLYEQGFTSSVAHSVQRDLERHLTGRERHNISSTDIVSLTLALQPDQHEPLDPPDQNSMQSTRHRRWGALETVVHLYPYIRPNLAATAALRVQIANFMLEEGFPSLSDEMKGRLEDILLDGLGTRKGVYDQRTSDLQALGKVGGPKSLEFLVKLVEENTSHLRHDAILGALYDIGTRNEFLLKLLFEVAPRSLLHEIGTSSLNHRPREPLPADFGSEWAPEPFGIGDLP